MPRLPPGNGQIRFGADVINRIIEQQKPGGKKKLQDAVIKETHQPLIAQMCKSAGISASHIYRMSVGANTTMNHLFAGINADPVRMEPYIPHSLRPTPFLLLMWELPLIKTRILLLQPNIGSYVGGDITTGTLVSMIWNRPEFSLFIDLGTNGELVSETLTL